MVSNPNFLFTDEQLEDLEVEVHTVDGALTVLSVYEHEGKLIVDVESN